MTYPIVSTLLGAPKVKAVRGLSDFGFSYIYVIFEDGTDIYWARSRVLEYLSKIQPRLPEGVRTELGPDATGVGWVFQYALVDRSGKLGLDELRSYQDWTLRYAVQAVPGVAEVASIGGFVRQYQVTVDPNRLAAYDVPLETVVAAVRDSNNEVGGRLLEFAGAEYMVRGRGYSRSVEDFAVGRRQGHRGRRAGAAARRGAGRDRAGAAPRGLGPRRHRRHRGRDRRHAPRRERAQRDPAGQDPPRGAQALAAARGRDRHDLRPLGPDHARDRRPSSTS